MRRKKRRPVYGKLQKSRVLRKNSQLASYDPPTKAYSKEILKDMLSKYGVVYVNPNTGYHGFGVMKVERGGDTKYRCQTGLLKKEFRSYNAMAQYIHRFVAGRKFLVQKGIRILHFKGRPFDIRVMIQKNMSNRKWDITGMAGRLAAPKRVVTNFNKGRNGASIVRVETLLSPHFSKPGVKRQVSFLKGLGYKVAYHFQKTYRSLKEIGLDVAYDKSRRPWLLEVNTTHPGAFMFKYLKDKKMFYRIKRYKKTYKD